MDINVKDEKSEIQPPPPSGSAPPDKPRSAAGFRDTMKRHSLATEEGIDPRYDASMKEIKIDFDVLNPTVEEYGEDVGGCSQGSNQYDQSYSSIAESPQISRKSHSKSNNNDVKLEATQSAQQHKLPSNLTTSQYSFNGALRTDPIDQPLPGNPPYPGYPSLPTYPSCSYDVPVPQSREPSLPWTPPQTQTIVSSSNATCPSGHDINGAQSSAYDIIQSYRYSDMRTQQTGNSPQATTNNSKLSSSDDAGNIPAEGIDDHCENCVILENRMQHQITAVKAMTASIEEINKNTDRLRQMDDRTHRLFILQQLNQIVRMGESTGQN